MMRIVSRNRPPRAAPAPKVPKAMDVILHIGAHRCATTSFQHYLRVNSDRLRRQGIGFWGPRRTRGGLFRGLAPKRPAGPGRRTLQHRAAGRVRMNLALSDRKGLKTLVVSDENMAGSVAENLSRRGLYDGIGERVARFHAAFDGQVRDVVLNVRSLDGWWASALGYGVARGRPLPDGRMIEHLAATRRSWRDVISDVACAAPGARLWVLPFETFAGRPAAQLGTVLGRTVPCAAGETWLNATPRLDDLRYLTGDDGAALPAGQGRWMPFSPEQAAALREAYADDLMWLAAGADGLAWLMNDPEKRPAGPNPPTDDMTRGRRYDHEEGRMAGAG